MKKLKISLIALIVALLAACSLLPLNDAGDVLNQVRSQVNQQESLSYHLDANFILSTSVLGVPLSSETDLQGQGDLLLDNLVSSTDLRINQSIENSDNLFNLEGQVYTERANDLFRSYSHFPAVSDSWQETSHEFAYSRWQVNLGLMSWIHQNWEIFNLQEDLVNQNGQDYYALTTELSNHDLQNLFFNLDIPYLSQLDFTSEQPIRTTILVNAETMLPSFVDFYMAPNPISNFDGHLEMTARLSFDNYNSVQEIIKPNFN